MSEKIINPDAENAQILAYNSKLKNAMEVLISNTSFQFFCELLQEQYDLRLKQVLQMPESADDIIKRTYVAGEIATFRVVINMPQLLLEGAKGMIESAHVYEEHDKEQRKYNEQDEDFDTD